MSKTNTTRYDVAEHLRSPEEGWSNQLRLLMSSMAYVLFDLSTSGPLHDSRRSTGIKSTMC